MYNKVARYRCTGTGIDHSSEYVSRVEVSRSKPVEVKLGVAEKWHSARVGAMSTPMIEDSNQCMNREYPIRNSTRIDGKIVMTCVREAQKGKARDRACVETESMLLNADGDVHYEVVTR